MDGEAVQKIADLARENAAPITIEGVNYVRGAVTDPRAAEPLPATLSVFTLTSLVEFLENSKDFAADDELFLHVAPTTVQVRSKLFGRFQQRKTLIEAKADPFLPTFPWERYMTLEEMVIGLQTMFVDTAQRKGVLKVVGNVRDENVKQTTDDGVTQTVTGRAGIVNNVEIMVPNPVMLRPFRTFPEVEQPEGMFVLRMRTGGHAALFVADGNIWKLRAVEFIKAWLKKSGVVQPIIG